MDKLIAYLNSLSKPDRAAFAARCKTSEGYMRKARSAGQKFRTDLCVRIENESGRAVLRQDLRDDWAIHWPELAAASSSGGPDVVERAKASDDVQPPVGDLDEDEGV